MYLSQCLNNLCWDVIFFTSKARSWPLCFLKRNGIGKQNRWIILPNLMFVIKKNQWISPLKEKFNDLSIYINLYINILIPNAAEKNILILVEREKKIWFRVLSYKLMLNSGEKNILNFVLSENQIKIYEDGICCSEPAV